MPTFTGTVEDGRFKPDKPEHYKAAMARLEGRSVRASFKRPAALRSLPSNRRYWAVVRHIAYETGNDPKSVHHGLKRWALEDRILEPQYFYIGETMLEDDPTTVVEQDAFNRYTYWVETTAAPELGVDLTVTEVEETSLVGIAREVAARLVDEDDTEAEDPIDEMSEEELDALLAAEMADANPRRIP